MKDRAFTLGELLVVIGIIGLLVSILLPTLSKARQAAMDIKCQSNLRQVGIALMLYADQNKNVMPGDSDYRYKDTDGDRPARSLGWWDDPYLWINAVTEMFQRKSYGQLQLEHAVTPLPNMESGKSALICPMSTEPGQSNPANNEAAGGYHLMYGHANPVPRPGTSYPAMSAGTVDRNGQTAVQRRVYSSYAMNSYLQPTVNKVTKEKGVAKQSQLRPASDIVLVLERRMNLAELPASVSAAYGAPNGNDLPSRRLNRIKAKWDYATARHRGGGNILMADGHVGWFSMKEIVLPPGYTAGATTVDFNQPGRIIWSPYEKALP